MPAVHTTEAVAATGSRPRQSREIRSLTGLRGIAALAVAFFHIHNVLGYTQPFRTYAGLWQLRRGWHAVDLFFMLSGFVLMYAHERDFFVLHRQRTIRFAWLRFTRVYPVNAAVLGLIACFVLLDPAYVAWMRTQPQLTNYAMSGFFRSLTLSTRWFLKPANEWNEPIWSLSVEILGYVTFPLLAYGAVRLQRTWQNVLLLIVSLSVYDLLAYLNGSLLDNYIGQWVLFRMLPCFIAGIAIFRLRSVCRRPSGYAISFAALAAVVGMYAGIYMRDGDLVYNPLFAILIFALSYQHDPVHRCLSSWPIWFLGRISFPLYLVHLLPLWWMLFYTKTHPGRLSVQQAGIWLLVWFVGIIGLSTGLHYWIEKPAHEWGRRLAKKPDSSAPSVPQGSPELASTVTLHS